MEPFRYHVYVCEQSKPEGVPCCAARGAQRLIEALRAEVVRQGLSGQVQITSCGSLGLCERGPNMVVYPEGVWYSGVELDDVTEIVNRHFRQGHVVERLRNPDAAALRAEIEQNQRRRIESLKAQEAAGQLPEDLMQRLRAFQESRILLTAIELDLFTAVSAPAPAAEIAARLGSDPRATEMLLNALAALGLLTKRDGVFHNTPVAARYFVQGSPDYARPALMHTVHLWNTWSNLTRKVCPDAEKFAMDWTEAFIAAMHLNARFRAPVVAEAVGIAGVRRMLDVGGGSGAYSIAFARANPELRADILDLPEVLDIAKRHIQEAGLGERISTVAGDLRKDKLGEGYDLVLLSAICHMLSVEENQDLIRRCFEALAPGGRIVIQDFILEADKTAPRTAALFSINMLVGTSEGASYSEPEYAGWLGAAGFSDIRRVRLPGPTGLMIGVRPL